MEYGDIKRLVKLVEGSDIDELNIEEKDFKVRITKSRPMPAPVIQSAPAPVAAPAAVPPPVPQTAGYKHMHQEAPVHSVESQTGTSENQVEICSPMVGTFYRASSPEAAPFAKEGDTIKPGQVLCIIEAMKLMNELEAEISGKIVKILVDNAQPVEYNQPLFLVEKG